MRPWWFSSLFFQEGQSARLLKTMQVCFLLSSDPKTPAEFSANSAELFGPHCKWKNSFWSVSAHVHFLKSVAPKTLVLHQRCHFHRWVKQESNSHLIWLSQHPRFADLPLMPLSLGFAQQLDTHLESGAAFSQSIGMQRNRRLASRLRGRHICSDTSRLPALTKVWEISPAPCWVYSRKNQGGSEGLRTVGPSINLCRPKVAICFIIVRFEVIKIGMWVSGGVISSRAELFGYWWSLCLSFQRSQNTTLAFQRMWIFLT